MTPAPILILTLPLLLVWLGLVLKHSKTYLPNGEFPLLKKPTHFSLVGCEQANGQGPLPECASKPSSADWWRPKEKEQILEYHNFLRQNVLEGALPGLPKAKMMKPLVWDEQLAKEAQR